MFNLDDLPFGDEVEILDHDAKIRNLVYCNVPLNLSNNQLNVLRKYRDEDWENSKKNFPGTSHIYINYFRINKFVIDYIVNEENMENNKRIEILTNFSLELEKLVYNSHQRKDSYLNKYIELNNAYVEEFYKLNGKIYSDDPEEQFELYADFEFQDKLENELGAYLNSKSDYLSYKYLITIDEMELVDLNKSKYYLSDTIFSLKHPKKERRKKNSATTNLGLNSTVLLFDLLGRENVISTHQSNISEAIEIMTGYSSKQANNAFGKIKKLDTRKLHKDEVQKLLETILKKLEI